MNATQPAVFQHAWARVWAPKYWRMGDGSLYSEPVAGSSLLVCLQDVFELGKGVLLSQHTYAKSIIAK